MADQEVVNVDIGIPADTDEHRGFAYIVLPIRVDGASPEEVSERGQRLTQALGAVINGQEWAQILHGRAALPALSEATLAHRLLAQVEAARMARDQ